MTPRAKKALEGSIAKWEKILTGATQDKGPRNCALCQEYNRPQMPEEKLCHGCPVYERTSKQGCKDTPYDAFLKATKDQSDGYAYSVSARRASLAMLRFLEALR